jgi:hypothetical protein
MTRYKSFARSLIGAWTSMPGTSTRNRFQRDGIETARGIAIVRVMIRESLVACTKRKLTEIKVGAKRKPNSRESGSRSGERRTRKFSLKGLRISSSYFENSGLILSGLMPARGLKSVTEPIGSGQVNE